MKQQNKRKAKRDIYQEVTDKIIGHLERGTAPWRNPIRRGTGDGWPKNLDSGKRYRGINVFLLGLTSWERGYSSDFWLTFKQAAAAGGQVRKGEKGSLVTFWKMYATKDRETGLDVDIPMLKHYTAFNLDQIEGIEPPDAPATLSDRNPFEPIKAAERIVEGYVSKPTIEHDGGGRAFYRPSTDTIHMPEQGRFENPECYYSTLFHEITHSTGHSKRLDRGLDTKLSPFGSNDYSKEELVAEMGAAFLSASAGISPPTIEQSASYLQSWINVLRGDKRLVVSAAASAQKATDLVLGNTFETVATPTQKIASSQQRIDDLEQSVNKPADPASIQLDLF
ncbi:ssDNA-binding domain-containing protein [Rhodopirellula sp. JC740]|uniref:SsDNA-binding domain-containing protein n=1 Tax=Rhodopirellula halodulae TaxID=2894198 RepID=A0ABS8NNM3_9BACT|nr:zincin-like metallopeptidase domain-containing protein [Rhodopirellula sp. JC740]MCC9645192.1 ssDNA-binding domain-containing protein [Rhodopirellula sp. JC740]